MIREQRKVYMSRRLRGIIILSVVLIGLSGGISAGLARESSDSSIIGPYTEIMLPLEDLPALNENLVANPTLDLYENGATLQVMYVLADPRDVPLARYAYYKEGTGVVAPTNYAVSGSDLPEYTKATEELVSHNPKTINVYVRVQAPAGERVPDPLFLGNYTSRDDSDFYLWSRYNLDRPALLVYPPVQDSQALPCAVPEYIDGTEPYQLPPDLDGGEAIGSDGLYDPAAYAPPRPWYDNQNPMLEPGEVREGWVSCLAPDIPLENIEVRVWHSYMTTPDPTPTPGPSPTPFGAGGDECVVVESLDDPACQEGCCTIILVDPTVEAMINATSEAITVEEGGGDYESREAIWSEPVWNYYKTSSFPDEGIRLEDVGMVFINEEGDQKTASGTVFIKSANVVQIERYANNDFRFVAEVSVEPVGLSEEDLQGYVLYRVDADVEVYEKANASFENRILLIEKICNYDTSNCKRFLQANFIFLDSLGSLRVDEGKQSFDNMFRHEPVSPYEGYLFADLVPDNDSSLSHYNREWNEPLPSNLWFSIDTSIPAITEFDDSREEPQPKYKAKGVNIYNTSLVSSTTMCDVVDCLDVQDPKDKKNEVRTVPLMCPGEWANNFLIDRLSIEDIDYIGSPEGLISNFAPDLFSYIRFINEQPRAWIHSGRIMGGLSPWWSMKEYYNSGKMVDLNSGSYITGITYDATIGILPYYSKISKAYYVPAGDYNQGAGWISDIASNKLLVFGIVDDKRYNEENTGFLFLEEGPVWKYTCSRSIVNGINEIDSYSPPLNGSSFEIYERYHQMKFMLPGFAYPVSEPRINGEVLPLGSEGPLINEQVLKPVEVKTIPGKANEPIYYVHSEDAFYPARKNESDNNLIYLRNADAQLIPPDSSLILVRLEKVSPAGQLDCRTSPDKIQISYPGYYPITTSPERLLEFNTGVLAWVCSDNDFNENWLVFKFPSLNVDPSQLTFSIMGEKNWVFWSLSDN